MKKKVLIGIVAVIIAIGVIGSLGGDKKETSVTSEPTTTQEVAKVAEEPKKEIDESVPMEYKSALVKADWKENALKKAISYQQDMNMSRKSVYEQLVSEYGEKFTKEEADYALEKLPK